MSTSIVRYSGIEESIAQSLSVAEATKGRGLVRSWRTLFSADPFLPFDTVVIISTDQDGLRGGESWEGTGATGGPAVGVAQAKQAQVRTWGLVGRALTD